MTRTVRNRPQNPQEQNPLSGRRTWFTVIALTIIAVGVGVAFFGDSNPQPPSLDDGSIDKAVVRAVSVARQNVLANPDSAELWGKLGMTFLAHEFLVQAAECFEETSRLEPSNAKWPYLQARCVYQQEPDIALELLKKSVDICGNRPEAPRLWLVELLMENGQLEAAERHLQTFTEEVPNAVRANHAMARLQFINEQYEECRITIESMFNQVKSKYDAQKARAQELAKMGYRKDAQKVLNDATVQLNASLAKQKSIGLLLASALRNLGRIEDAEKQRKLSETTGDRGWSDPYLTEVRKLTTGRKKLLVEADLAFGRKQYDQSIRYCNDAIKNYPDSLPAYIMLGRAYIRMARVAREQNKMKESREYYAHADRFLRKGLEYDKNSVESLFRLGVVLVDLAEIDNSLDKYQEAKEVYQRAVQLKSDFTMAYFNLSGCLEKLGDLDGAIQAMRDTVGCEPDYVAGYVRLAELLLKANHIEEAETQILVALKLQPDFEVAQNTLRKIRAKDLGFDSP